jgi:large subunit ribosomal protein L25
MKKVVLKATPRTVTGKKVKALRREGTLPAVIYGHRVEPIAISFPAHEAGLTLGRISSSQLVTVELDGKEYPTLVREKQRDYIRGTLTHVDFLAVSLDEKIRASVGIETSGASPAVKDFNAVLVSGLTALEVEALPADLPERVVVDLSSLLKIGDVIHVSDVHLSDKVQVLDAPDELIVIATAPKVEVIEEVVPVAEVEGEEPEISVERGKKEGEEAEEQEEEAE